MFHQEIFAWCYIFMLCWQHVSTLSPFFISSAISVFLRKKIIAGKGVYMTCFVWLPSLGVGLWPPHSPYMPHIRGCSVGVPLPSGRIQWPLLPRPWPLNGQAWTKLPISPSPYKLLLLPAPLWNVNLLMIPLLLMICWISILLYDMPNLPHPSYGLLDLPPHDPPSLESATDSAASQSLSPSE